MLAALAVGLLAAPADAADPPTGPRDISQFACPTGSVPDGGFVDTAGNTFERDIDCLAWYGITVGGPGATPVNVYGPRGTVTRAQMATFIVRFIDYVYQGAGPTLPPWDGQNRFVDVAASNTHIANINRLAAAGVVLGGMGGRPANQYSPSLPVRRDQMASYIARAIGYIFTNNICANVYNYFDDDNGNTHEPCINSLADLEVAAGDTSGRYRPSASVTRAQMAGYLMRSMDSLVEQQVAFPPA